MRKRKFTPLILSACIAVCSCIGTAVYAEDIPENILEVQQQANELANQPTQPPVGEEQVLADEAKEVINENPTGDNAEGANEEIRENVMDKLTDDNDINKDVIEAASNAAEGDNNGSMVGSVLSKNISTSVPIIIAAVISALAALALAVVLFGRKKQSPAKNTDQLKGGE